MEQKRGSFSGKIGFVLAAAGSAVGLGNLWRFPQLAANYGGGIFLLIYLILVLTFGFSLLIMEIALGRKTKSSCIVAYKKLDKRFGFLGYLAFLVPVLILPYYCVIGGWVTKYILAFAKGDGVNAASGRYFQNFISGTWEPLILFLVFLLITGIVVLGGVQKGVERASKVMMPILLIMTVGVCVFICTIPGIGTGIKYYLLPDFSAFSIKTVCAALGQLFYSMSIAMGIMVSYGSYVKDDVDLNKSVVQIETFDTLIAMLSGFMIVPAVYVLSGTTGLKEGGAGLMFVVLPQVFEKMPFGQLIGLAFFILVFFAAVTSSISIMEAIVSMIIDRMHWSRTKAGVIVLAVAAVLGVPSALGYGVWKDIQPLKLAFLDFFDYISNNVLMPIVCFVTCILIGWVVGTRVIEEEVEKSGVKFSRVKVFRAMVRYIAPVCMIVILVFYTLVTFGVINL